MIATNCIPSTPLPHIVLLVDDDRDMLDMYSTYFETSGVWVATSTNPTEALAAIDELRPDAIVTDLGFGGQPSGADFIHTLKSRESTRQTPVVLLSGRRLEDVPALTRQEANLCLLKPVLPDALLRQVEAQIAVSNSLQERGRALRERSSTLIQKAAQLTRKSEALANEAASRLRLCPECGKGLDWIERGRIDGSEYDYYRWCLSGCGLYCFDRHAARWVKLA